MFKKIASLVVFVISGVVSIDTFAVSGSTDTGLQNVICKNVTTGQSITIKKLKGATSWNCTTAGLLAKKGDTIKETLTGTVINDDTGKSCKEILANNLKSISGTYTIDPDGLDGNPPFQVYCDMTTDGGGWTLVLAYNHIGGENNDLVLGVPLNPTTGYAHMANARMQQLAQYSEARFYCNTSLHSRVIHFKTDNTDALSYIKNGDSNNDPSYWNSGFTPLTGHSANLPAATQNVCGGGQADCGNQGDYAMTFFPFWLWGAYHWAIRASSRWECDDWAGGYSDTTLHQIWVR